MSSKFAVFLDLPLEIREKTWEHAQEPRIVEICQIGNGQGSSKTKNEFYSPTPLPTTFSVNQESRDVVIKETPLWFPNFSHPAKIHYNPSIDILYFPAWCWQRNIQNFEKATSPEVKDKIQRIAIEALLWYSDWDYGMINNHIEIKKFRNLKELVVVERKPWRGMCGCCYEFERPETGVVEFREKELDEYSKGNLRRFKEEFARIMKRNKLWNEPAVRFVDLVRDGELF